MIDYIELTDSEIEPEAPIISSVGERFRDNAISIAQASPGAPKVAINGDSVTLSKSLTEWTVPDEVYRIRVTYSGGGGGGSSFFGFDAPGNTDGQNGESTSFANFDNALGGVGAKSDNPGRSAMSINDNFLSGSQGGQGQEQGNVGGPGQARIKIMDVNPGDVIAYSIGSGGTGSRNSGRNNDGADGFILVEY